MQSPPPPSEQGVCCGPAPTWPLLASQQPLLHSGRTDGTDFLLLSGVSSGFCPFCNPGGGVPSRSHCPGVGQVSPPHSLGSSPHGLFPPFEALKPFCGADGSCEPPCSVSAAFLWCPLPCLSSPPPHWAVDLRPVMSRAGWSLVGSSPASAASQNFPLFCFGGVVFFYIIFSSSCSLRCYYILLKKWGKRGLCLCKEAK